MLTDLHFLRPWWLLAVIPAAVLILQLLRRGQASEDWRRLIAPHLLPHLLDRARSQGRWAPNAWLLAAGWCICVIALAGPSWRPSQSPFNQEASLAVLILDCDSSMDETNLSPSRLRRGQFKISDLLARRGGSHALIAFAGSAHVVMPPTTDPQVIDHFARELSPKLMPSPGSNLQEAIEQAEAMLRNSQQAGCLVVVTDGVAQATAQKASVPIHIWGLHEEAKQLASRLGASWTALSHDHSDVDRIIDLCRHQVASSAAQAASPSWQENGFPLCFVLAGLMLVWFRRGFVMPTGAA